MIRLLLFVSITLFVAAAHSYADDIDTVAVRTWDIESDPGAAPPELADPDLAVPGLGDRASFGIAFSGGGTRSTTASLGELRALHSLGWLSRARYLTANSGGAWATLPYTYLPKSIDEDRFLGEYLPPEIISDANLKPTVVDPLELATAIHDAGTIKEFFELGRGDEAYADIVGSIFLEPFGLHDNEKFFSFHAGAVEQTLAGNPSLRADNFQVVEREDRPYLIVTGVVLAQQMSDNPDEYFPIEMTPLYTGIRGRFVFEKDGEIVVVGGGYVESFGYDSYEPHGKSEDGRWQVRLTGLLFRGDKPFGDRYRFTLSDVIGASSAAPLATLSKLAVPNLAFPEFRHWPVDRDAIDQASNHVRRKADEFQHGDGADIDNLAVMPLFARKTENILVFINSADAFRTPATGCKDISDEYITDDVVSLFRDDERLKHNRVIANGDAELKQLCKQFTARKAAGQPLVYCQAYDLLENDRYRIEPYRASICWAYLDKVDGWMDEIDGDAGSLTRQLLDGEGSFDNFPHYSTFAEQGIFLIDLNRERVIALSNLAAWSVLQSAETIANGLPGASLPLQ